MLNGIYRRSRILSLSIHIYRLHIIPISIGRIVHRSFPSDPNSLHAFHSLDPFPIVSDDRRRPIHEKSLLLHPRYHVRKDQIVDVSQGKSREADGGNDPPFDFGAGLVGGRSSGWGKKGGDYEKGADDAVDDGGGWAAPGSESGVCFPGFAFVGYEVQI